MKYGTIFSMDYERDLRLMAIGPNDPRRTTGRDIWLAVTILDPSWGGVTPEGWEKGWRMGATITFAPADPGITVIEEPAA